MDLMHMSSGLRCSSPFDPDYQPGHAYPDHVFAYTGATNAYEFARSRSIEFPPSTEGRYRNCDPLVVAQIVKDALAKRGQSILAYPQVALFDQIGIRKQVLETDAYGNPLFIGYDFGTARNWARLGLLYLNDGVWQGKRLLPEGWSRFVSTPAPAWAKPVYGAFFWLNGDKRFTVPSDAYFMSGAGGQITLILPTHRLVVVRMGYPRGDKAWPKALNAALEGIVASIRPKTGE
jgi:CubicO group peptidase (beta-lactamase class C family)